jgi:hypothetical protein
MTLTSKILSLALLALLVLAACQAVSPAPTDQPMLLSTALVPEGSAGVAPAVQYDPKWQSLMRARLIQMQGRIKSLADDTNEPNIGPLNDIGAPDEAFHVTISILMPDNTIQRWACVFGVTPGDPLSFWLMDASYLENN